MLLRLILISILLLAIIKPSYGYHYFKGNLKSDLPSCGAPLVGLRIPAAQLRLFEKGCHGEAKFRDGSIYKGEFKALLKYSQDNSTPSHLHGKKEIYMNGKGTFYDADGINFVGEFKKHRFVYGAEYKNGKFLRGGRYKNWNLVKSMPTPYSPKGSSVSQASLSPLKKSFQSLNSDRRKKIQESLSSEGFYNSTIDGLYGRGTEKALREYNKKYLSNSDLKKKDNVSALLAKLEEQKAPKPKVETKKEVVGTKTDTKKINKEWQLLAEEGSAMAQYKLASMYEQGEGILKDFVYAHMWANLSATNGYAEAKDLRDALEKKMTASQMEKAQDLARECMKNKFKGC